VPLSAAGTTEGSWTYTYYSSSTLTGLSTGSYYFYVVYSPGSSGYPSQHTCEPFSGTTGGSFPPPPSSVPQFPFGMALLLAVAIPGLLLVRSKYTGKHSSVPSIR
jgi:hypothetical protein